MKELLWNVLQVSLTTSIIILPMLLLCAALRRRYPARVLCLLWAVLSIRLLFPVQLTLPDALIWTPQTTISITQTATAVIPQAGSAAPVPSGSTEQTEAASAPCPEVAAQTPLDAPRFQPVTAHGQIDMMPVLALLWLIGVIGSLLTAFVSHQRFWKRIRRSARQVQDETLLAVYQQERERLGITREIPMMQSFAVEGPMLAGVLHPILLLPKEGIAYGEARLILRHELTHDKHGDLFCKLLFLLAKCVHWFNPVVQLMARQAVQDVEIACDQSVVHGLDDTARRNYGNCILNNAARQAQHREQSFTTQLTGGKKAMKTRLQALFTSPQKQHGILFLLIVCVAATAVGCSFAVEPERMPDAETVQQMEALAQRWCEAQQNQLSPAQAETLLGGALKEAFDEMVVGYGKIEPDTPLAFDNLPMDAQADEVTYKLDPKASAAQVKIHIKDTPYGGATQLQTIQFAQDGEALRIVGRSVDEAMLLDHPEEIDTTAQDVIRRGMPENPVDASTAMELVDENFPVAGGQYYFHGLDKNLMIYGFADGTMVYFEFEITADGKYRLKNVIEPQNNTPNRSDTQEITAHQVANQWASGYLHKNAAFSYPCMSRRLQQGFINSQEAEYGPTWFWRIGWGSSPSVGDWSVKPESKDSALIVYRLYGGGEEYRYAERIHWITENGRTVVDSYERIANGIVDGAEITREEFVTLYAAFGELEIHPPKLQPSVIQEWKESEPSRYAELLTPAGALQAAIPILYSAVYEIKQVSDEIPVDRGVLLDLKIEFPQPEAFVYVTMYRGKDQEYWQISRIWSGIPDHTT